MAHPIEALGIIPWHLQRFLTVVPEQPNAITVALLTSQLIGDFEQKRAGRPAIIRSDIIDVSQRPVSVVMARNHNDSITSAGKLCDDVMNRKSPFWGRHLEIILVD